VPLVQFIIFAKTRGDNLFQIEGHESQNFSDPRSKRKCRSRFSLRTAALLPIRADKKKLQDSERILQLNFCEI
jgi:hypothetical protein